MIQLFSQPAYIFFVIYAVCATVAPPKTKLSVKAESAKVDIGNVFLACSSPRFSRSSQIEPAKEFVDKSSCYSVLSDGSARDITLSHSETVRVRLKNKCSHANTDRKVLFLLLWHGEVPFSNIQMDLTLSLLFQFSIYLFSPDVIFVSSRSTP